RSRCRRRGAGPDFDVSAERQAPRRSVWGRQPLGMAVPDAMMRSLPANEAKDLFGTRSGNRYNVHCERRRLKPAATEFCPLALKEWRIPSRRMPIMSRRLLLSLPVPGWAALSLAHGAMSKKLDYPPAKKDNVVEKIHGVEIADPYRWLEEADNPAVKEWVEKENALTRNFL